MIWFGRLFDFCELHASRVRSVLLDPAIVGPGPRYYDRQGFPIPWRDDGDGWIDPTLVWARMMEARDGPIAQDEFPDGSRLSTVWLGLDHNWGFGRPLFFETMYFSGDDMKGLEFPDPLGEQDEMTEQLRYGSEEEALAAHREIARRIQKRWEV